MSQQTPPTPVWQRAIGVVIGTAIGGVIYGIFLQALLIQSLLIERHPIDPADWKEKLTGKAWICGLCFFLLQIGLPFRFVARPDSAGNVIPDLSEISIVGILIALILVVQIATVCYAAMRPELCMVERPTERFDYLRICSRKLAPVLREETTVIVSSPLHTATAPAPAPAEFTVTVRSAVPPPDTRSPLIRLSFAIGLWKNWVQLAIVMIEFVQLMAMALDGGQALQTAGVSLLSPAILASLQSARQVVWQFGMRVPRPDDPSPSFATGFGMLTGFGGLYIVLCGVFIALDLTVDSWLSPFLFTLLAGGFYGMITSGLLLVILYSTSSVHILVGLLLLAYYSSTAVFVSIYRSDVKKAAPGEIRIIPTFTAIERVSKGILAGVGVAAAGASPVARLSVVVVFCAFFLGLLVRMRPYSSFSVTALRITGVAIAGWTAFIMCFVAAQTTAEYGPIFTTLLVSGFVCIPGTMVTLTHLLQRPLAGAYV